MSDPDIVARPAWQALRAVGRRSLPRLVEATLIPSVLIYVIVATTGSLWPAALAALGWAIAALVFRAARGQRISGILGLAVVGLGLRTAFAFLAGSSFVYFLQPIIGALVIASVFFASLLTVRPMVARLAEDFCPLTPEVVAHPRVQTLFRRLTVLWGAVNVVNATLTFWLLSTLSTQQFVLVKTVGGLSLTVAAITTTVICAVRLSRREGLLHGIALHGLALR